MHGSLQTNDEPLIFFEVMWVRFTELQRSRSLSDAILAQHNDSFCCFRVKIRPYKGIRMRNRRRGAAIEWTMVGFLKRQSSVLCVAFALYDYELTQTLHALLKAGILEPKSYQSLSSLTLPIDFHALFH